MDDDYDPNVSGGGSQRVTGGNDPATPEMVADILTKSTPAPLFVVMASIMSGMHRK